MNTESIPDRAGNWKTAWRWSLFALGAVLLTGCPRPSTPPGEILSKDIVKREPRGGAVHGTIIVRVESKSGDKRIVFVPDFEVLLRNRDTGEEVRQRTDVYGRYYFPEQKPGTYLLSWTAQRGLGEGQFRAPLVIANGEAYPPQIELGAQKGNILLVGRVTFANGDMTGFIQEVYGLIKTPLVKISSPEPELSLVMPADYRGDYVAGIDARSLRAGVTIKATLDGGEGEKGLNQNLEARDILIADLAIKNAAPRIGSIIVRDAEERLLRQGQPGQKVSLEIEATDADKDPLEVRWMTTKGLEPQGLKARWIVPEKPGVYPLEAVVTDGRGGYGRGPWAKNSSGSRVAWWIRVRKKRWPGRRWR